MPAETEPTEQAPTPAGEAGVSTKHVHEAMTGVILSVLITLSAFSYARLIFAEPIESFTSLGFVSAMVSALVIGLFVARGSSLPGTVAIPQDRVAPIFALMATAIASSLPHETDPGTAAVLVLGGIALTTVTTGVVLLVLGRLRLGNLLRFIPYPVVGGFLAASGWLLFRGGLQILTGSAPGTGMMTWFQRSSTLYVWTSGTVLAFGVAVAMRRRPRPLLVPAVLIFSIVGFYAIALGSGLSSHDMRTHGLLASAIPPPWQTPIDPASALQAPWNLLVEQTGLVATILFTTFISILLSSSAIELSTNQEADLNRELRVSGWGNIVAGIFGGMVGFHSLSMSRLSLSLGGRSRLAATVAAASCGVLLLAGPLFLGYLPNLVPGVLLMLLGLGLLLEWVVDGYTRLTRTDYAIVLLILATVAAAGYFEGVGVGIVATVVLFIVKYSQVSVVNLVTDGRSARSNVERPTWHLELLEREGDRILMMRLRGFVFFGTAAEIVSTLRERTQHPTRPRMLFAVLDCQRVTGLDSSAAVALTKARLLAEKEGFRLALCGLSPRVRRDLTVAGMATGSDDVRVFPDFDHALEWTEDALIGRYEGRDTENHLTLADQLNRSWPRPNEIERLMPYLERVDFAAGKHLIRQGDLSDTIYFIESGHVTARIEQGGERFTRLRRQGGGTIVGELGFYLHIARTASVVADTDGVAYRLRRVAMERIARDDPSLESSLHQFVVKTLAARNAFINASLHHTLN